MLVYCSLCFQRIFSYKRSEIIFFREKKVTQAQQLIRFCSLHTLRSILESSVFIKYFSFDPNWVASWIFN